MGNTASNSKPKGSLHKAEIKIILSEWYAEFRADDGVRHRLPVSDLDAWNFDIENDLPVEIAFYRGSVRILRKIVGNKRYVLTTEENSLLQQNL